MDFSPRKMDRSEVPEEMDPDSTFKLKVWSTSPGCRKDVGYFTFTKYVDKDTTNYKDFCDDYAKEFPWGLNESLHLSYFDEIQKTFVDVKSDQEMMAIFGKFGSSKYIHMKACILPIPAAQTVTNNTQNAPRHVTETIDHDISSEPSNSKVAITPSSALQTSSLQSILCDTGYLSNPFPMYEHVRIDEEGMYGVEVGDVIIHSTCVDEDNGGVGEEEGSGEEEESSELEGSGEDEVSSEVEGSGEEEESNEQEESNEGVDTAVEDWVTRDFIPNFTRHVVYDKEDPPMTMGSIYPSIAEFKVALSQHCIKHKREFNTEKSATDRVRVYCASKNKVCKWRIHASVLQDNVIVQVKVNPYEHTCSSRRRSKRMKNATKFWICEQVLEWVSEDPSVGPKELRRRIKDKYKIDVPYKRVQAGKILAVEKAFGKWHDNFDVLFRWKVEVERRCPGSVVIIDYHTIEDKRYFSRMFVAFKGCLDGFLRHCRPYLSIDSTFLTGMFKGQLATACAIDGHNWLFPVAFAIMECESAENWKWFMERLHDVVGDPPGLAICTDAGKGLAEVKSVFTVAQHRECMRHLVMNFRKKFCGKVYDENLWPAAYAWQIEKFDEHMENIILRNAEVKS